MIGWAVGEVLFLRTIFYGGGGFRTLLVLYGLLVWSVPGYAFSFPFFSALGLSRETVWREGPYLCVRHSILGLRWWTWRYVVEEIGPFFAPSRQPMVPRALRSGGLVVADDDGPIRGSREEGLSGSAFRSGAAGGGVRFLYEGKESFIGAGLDEGQAARLAEVLALRFGLRLGTGPSGV